MEKILETIKFKGSNVLELQYAITRLTQHARIASNGQAWGGMETMHLADEDGFSVTHLELAENTLTDGSKVYDVRLYFAVPDFSQADGIAKEDIADAL